MRAKIYLLGLFLGFTILFTSNQLLAQTFPGSTITISGTGTNTNSGTATVSGVGTVANGADITLRVQFNHTWVSDLGIWLVAPGGQVLELCTGLGGSNNNGDMTFSDAAATNIATAPVTTSTGIGGCPPTTFAYNGTFRPEGRNAAVVFPPSAPSNVPAAGTFTFANRFSGLNANGIWRLYMNDHAGGDGGASCIWTVNIVPQISPCAENFDGVTPPALPSLWSATSGVVNASSAPWTTTNAANDNPPNSAFTNDPNSVSDEYLDSRPFPIISAAATLNCRINYDLESTFDGMVLEISMGGGPFQDIIVAGGSFVAGAYNGVISGSFGSPIANRNAWTGNSGGFITVTANLPAAANGQNVVLRWRRATDVSVSGVGVFVDNVSITGSNCLIPVCTLTCPANIVVSNDPNQCGAVVNYPAPTTSGTCGPVFTSPASGSFFPRGTTTVTATAAGGGTCTFTITVNDVQPPTITCPANITVNNSPGQCGAIVNYPAPTVSDNCPGVTIVSTPASGSLFPKGTTTVTATATDAGGNTATCSFTVTVNDTQAPTITCPANITVGNDPGVCGAVVNYALPTYSDNCALPGPQTLSQNTSNTLGPVIQIGCQVAGPFTTENSYWRAFNLGPLGLPGPLTVNTLTFGIETANANGTGTTQPVDVRLYTSAGPFPASPRTLIASQTVQVPDQTNSLFNVTLAAPPVVPANAILVYEVHTPDGRPPVNNAFFIGSNNLGQTAPCYIAAAACGVPNPVTLASLGFPNMHIIMNIGGVVAGPNPLTLISGLAPGATFPVGTTTNTYRVTDASGNTAQCSFNVTVNDVQAPTITCPSNMTVTTPVGSCTATVNYTVTSSDNCPGVVQALQSGLASGSAFPLGVNTVTWRATDASGNISTCSFTITVLDAQLPVISQQPANTTACSGSNATFSVTATNVLTYQWQSWNGSTWNNIAGANASTYTVNNVNVGMNTNSYRVILNGLCTVVTSTHASLYVNPLPTIHLSANPAPVLLPGQTTTITATVNPAGGTVQWFKVGTTGAIATGLSITVGVDGIGTYRAVYTDLNGCVNTSSDIEVKGAPSGNVFVYPNPNTGTFQVRYYNTPNESATVNIYDARGARIYQRAVVTSTPYSEISVTLGPVMPAGVYIVEVVNGSGVQIGARRFVLERR